MSGAFEIAGGSFAVLGAADVLVRSGLKIYDFLRDVAGAPKEIDCLRELLDDVMRLLKASLECHADLTSRNPSTTPSQAAALLDSAMKRLDRELKRINQVILKFNGKGSMRWNNVKHVLDKTNLEKMRKNLAEAKALLASALTLASR
jgi:hypothetical protein